MVTDENRPLTRVWGGCCDPSPSVTDADTASSQPMARAMTITLRILAQLRRRQRNSATDRLEELLAAAEAPAEVRRWLTTRPPHAVRAWLVDALDPVVVLEDESSPPSNPEGQS